MSAPSYPELYFCLCKLCCCYPPAARPPSYKSCSAPTCRRLAGEHSLKFIWPQFKLMQVFFHKLCFVCVLNTSAICIDKKGFALFTPCLERRSQLTGPRGYVRESPAFKLSWRRGRDAQDGEAPSLQFTFPLIYLCDGCFPSFLQQLRAYAIEQTGAKYRKVLPHNLYKLCPLSSMSFTDKHRQTDRETQTKIHRHI